VAAKNAILIVEFAKLKREQGKSLVEAALEGAKLRLRPILMTSFAFILGYRAPRKSVSENTRFRSTWSDHNPGLLLAGSALVPDASAGPQSTSWSPDSISITA
jgi:hypothetical protein